MITHPLLPKLRQLKLSGMLQTLDLRAVFANCAHDYQCGEAQLAKQAQERGLSPIEFFSLLIEDELERRNQQRHSRRLAQSGCDPAKTLAHFDFNAAVGVNRTLIQELATCAFVARHENVLFCGATGLGKSHLANALAGEALRRDYRVLSRTTQRLLTELQAARANGTYSRHFARLLGVDLLLLDDFGLHPLTPQAVQDLYELISERYERGSLLITSNRAFEEWAELFANDLLASAALDRLTHHAHIMVFRGQSYRQRSRRKEVPNPTAE